MNLLSKARDAIFIHNAEARIRAEHYQWAADAQLGVTYYTLAPTTRYDEWTNRPVHASFVFIKRATWGSHTGQLLTANNTPSWRLWRDMGPFTTKRMPTAKDHWREDEKAFAGFSTRAQQQVGREVAAELARLYPASVEHALAAAA
jgi:hypothetical protein